MNSGGISNNSQNIKSNNRTPLYNISARKNQMEHEQNYEYGQKQAHGNILGQSYDYNNSKNILEQKQNGNAQSNNIKSNQNVQNENKQSEQQQINYLKDKLRDAIDENECLREEVTRLEALYAAAEDEIEKRDSCIQELLVEIQKLTETGSSSQKVKNGRKRTFSQ